MKYKIQGVLKLTKTEQILTGIVVFSLILGFFLPLSPSLDPQEIEYFDIIYLYGGSVYDPIVDYHYDRLIEVTAGTSLSMKLINASDLVDLTDLYHYRSSMLIGLFHGMMNYSIIGDTHYFNYQVESFLLELGIRYLVLQSCYSYRFQNLPDQIDILASSNDTESIFKIRLGGAPEWEFIDSFLDHFSFDFSQSFPGMINDLSIQGAEFDDEANMTIWSRVDGSYTYHDFK